MIARVLGYLVAATCVLASCTFDEGANGARGCDAQCAPGACYLGYCLRRLDDPPGSGAPITGMPPTAGSHSPIAGSGAAGQGGGSGQGGGAPTAGASSAAGSEPGAAGQGGSGPGVPVAGSGGPSCTLSTPAEESCNGLDDNCNGFVDEGTDVVCYPDDLEGCAVSAAGDVMCDGICTAGTRTCAEGTLLACEGFVGPTQEECGGAQAADESCDGAVDDGCPCSGTETQRCYGGPLFTAGVGLCRAGTQRCENGELGTCEDEVTPVAESCANQGADDDCNFVRDDVAGAGQPCVRLGQLGECRYGVRGCQNGALVCVTPAPLPTETACDLRDEDCDGAVDENYDFPSDEDHCGACDVQCSGELACCAGACVATNTVEHCGGCNGCAAGQACCGGACVATDTVQHCGGCDGCGPGQACCAGACVATDTVEHCGGCGGCGPDQACCGGACVDTHTGAHCGGCNPCGEGQACCDGTCVGIDSVEHCGGCRGCLTGEACCGRACVDPSTDSDHCSACGIDCGDTCTCQQGECTDGDGSLCL